MIHLWRSVFEIKSQEFSATLKLKAELLYGILVCSIFERELRHNPQDCNYVRVYLKSKYLTCLLVALHQCPQFRYTRY